MKRFAFAGIALLFVATTAFADATQRYLVATKRPFRAGALDAVRRATRDIEPRAVAGFETFNGFAADLTVAEVEMLRVSPEVRWVEPVLERHAFDVDRNLLGQTTPSGIDLVGARQAALGHATGIVNVVVIDTGIDFNHPELKNLYAGGINVLDEAVSAMDDNSHGTHVSGTIAAIDNSSGVVGVATSGIRLWAVKALDYGGAGTTEGVIKGIDWVTNQKKTLGGNWVVNLSLGSTSESPGEREAFQRAADAGVAVVAATGNSSTPDTPAPVAYPAAYPMVIAVGAVYPTRELAYFSNQGPEVDFTAPGLQVLSTVPVGSSQIAYYHDGTRAKRAAALTGSKLGTVTSNYVYCGVGRPEDFTTSVQGKIALIKRGGDITFANKTREAKKNGAIAVMIFNHDQSVNPWTLISDAAGNTEEWPVVLRLSLAQGEELVAKGGGTLTLAYTTDDYGEKSGTSMASPHVAGAVAALWALAPNATPQQIVNALASTAIDMGNTGQDDQYGYGVINVYGAARQLAPNAFANGPTTGRGIGRRQ